MNQINRTEREQNAKLSFLKKFLNLLSVSPKNCILILV
jgi:hypothetical protein